MKKLKNFSKCSIESLVEVSKVFETLQIEWWIDQGSLLGIVRDKKFLPWDHDIDIGIWDMNNIDKNKLLKLFRQHFSYVYYDKLNKTIKIFFYDNKIKETWWYDISFYEKKALTAEKQWFRPIESKTNIYKYLLTISTIIFIGYGTPGSSIKSKIAKHILSPIHLVLEFFNISDYIGNIFLEIVKNNYSYHVDVSCDIKYFSDLSQLNIDRIVINVPKSKEEYLEYKYGKDWKTPKVSWDYLQDDGGLKK